MLNDRARARSSLAYRTTRTVEVLLIQRSRGEQAASQS